ncbi:MAG: thymidylate synthase [Patescibacteria group bacterium]
MSSFDFKYQSLLSEVRHAPIKSTRSGVDAHMLPGATFVHDLSEGFPLTTLRTIPFHLIASELEFNLQGITDKRWLQERGNHIWDEWCNPSLVPYARDAATRRRMHEERDLGPLYGFEWRHFGAKYEGYANDYSGQGVDQITWLLETIKTDPNSKRMVVSCWNPQHLTQQAIPPCPFAFKVSVFENTMHLFLFQRSIDIMLGFPFDLAQYALLLHLLAQETGYIPGTVTAFFGNVELYVTHEDQADEILSREPHSALPRTSTSQPVSVLTWAHTDTRLDGYQSHPHIKISVAI